MNIGFILASYGSNEPAGMERSVAALIEGLNALGHRAVVIGAGPRRPDDGNEVYRLRSLSLKKPATDAFLLESIVKAAGLAADLDNLGSELTLDIVCWVDCLWGLGLIGRPRGSLKSILAVHVLGPNHALLEAALSHGPDIVVVPSSHVLEQARKLGKQVDRWRVVPNALLEAPRPATAEDRRGLRVNGPFRMIARLGAEKGILELIADACTLSRPLEIVLAEAAFEASSGSQSMLKAQCLQASRKNPLVKILPALPWRSVPEFLKGASITIIPSRAETFGLVALESMSVGTPVAAFLNGNLPELIGGAGIVVPLHRGHTGLLQAADAFLADESVYIGASCVALSRALEYHSSSIAKQWLKTVTN